MKTAGMICAVLVVAAPAFADPFGTPVGSFMGVTAYSNGSNGFAGGGPNYQWGFYTGVRWQCVEYARRFYLTTWWRYLPAGYDANAWYAAGMGLNRRPNGGTVAPQVGDVLCSASGISGHVAIIRQVCSTYVVVVHQNWSNSSLDNYRVIPMSIIGGRYTIQPLGSYSWQGWLSRF